MWLYSYWKQPYAWRLQDYRLTQTKLKTNGIQATFQCMIYRGQSTINTKKHYYFGNISYYTFLKPTYKHNQYMMISYWHFMRLFNALSIFAIGGSCAIKDTCSASLARWPWDLDSWDNRNMVINGDNMTNSCLISAKP